MNQMLEKFCLDESLYPVPGPGEKKRYFLSKDETSELILMIWGTEAMSPIHDHAGSECWTFLLKGELVEKVFRKDNLSLLSEETLYFRETRYIDKEEGVHQLMNKTSELVYSLHLYKKPLSHCNTYDLESRSWSILENHYDEIFEVRV